MKTLLMATVLATTCCGQLGFAQSQYQINQNNLRYESDKARRIAIGANNRAAIAEEKAQRAIDELVRIRQLEERRQAQYAAWIEQQRHDREAAEIAQARAAIEARKQALYAAERTRHDHTPPARGPKPISFAYRQTADGHWLVKTSNDEMFTFATEQEAKGYMAQAKATDQTTLIAATIAGAK
jgi:hypothetical protein